MLYHDVTLNISYQDFFISSFYFLIIWQVSSCTTHCNVKIKLNDMKKQSDMIMMSKVKNMDDNSQTLLCKILISQVQSKSLPSLSLSLSLSLDFDILTFEDNL